MVNVGILGSGGREHALAYALSHSDEVQTIWVIPGNGGTACYFKNSSVAVKPPYEELVAFLREEDITFVVVGPENYLAEGVVDVLTRAGIMVWGPTAQASQLESSKIFAKKIMDLAGVRTAAYAAFTQSEEGSARKYLEEASFPIVLKADGLCAGKGVLIVETLAEALAALEVFWNEKRFGGAAGQILIEEFLTGPELSILALSDGQSVKILAPAQDHKRLEEGDQGPNTGGMGVYTPVPFLDAVTLQEIEETLLLPIIQTMEKEGNPFKGVLYAGLLKDEQKGYHVLEFNVRFGDPECECVLPLFTGDIYDVLRRGCLGDWGDLNPNLFGLANRAAVTVVLASGGYPDKYTTGHKITGLDAVKHSLVFHAGTRYDSDEKAFYTTGGRVLAVTAMAETLELARQRVYEDVKKIDFEGKYYRKDIGLKGLTPLS